MSDLFNEPLARSLIVPFIAALAAAGVVRLIGGEGRGQRLAGAGLAIGVAAAELAARGVPAFPPPPGGADYALAAACGLLIGGALDLAAPRREAALTIVVLTALAGAWWSLGAPTGWGGPRWAMLAVLPTVAAWLLVLPRLHQLGPDRHSAPVMVLVAALGLGAAALAGGGGGAPVRLVFGLAAAAAGFLAWTWSSARFPFGAAAVLSGGGALLLSGAELARQGMVPDLALLVLALVFFADGLARRLTPGPDLVRQLGYPLVLAGLCLVPAVLAVTIAYVGGRL